MASNPIGREAQPVTLPGTIPPMPVVARILSRYDRGKLAAFVTVAIDLLDVLDGEPDAEDDDPGEAVGDERGDPAYLEWHTRGSHKMDRHGAERLACDLHGNFLHEDAEEDDAPEEDDPSGQRDEDEYNTGGDPGLWLGDCDLEPARVPPQWPAPVAND